jgi:hypothetical protein
VGGTVNYTPIVLDEIWCIPIKVDVRCPTVFMANENAIDDAGAII